MFRVLVNTEGAAQAGGMFPGGGDGGGGDGKLDPLQPVTSVPPPPPDATGAETGVEQYHAVCTSADVASCVPACNAEHHGYELLATIDSTDTKFSCSLAHGLYSWMGAASEGGYLGADAQSFFSAVVSGAAGSYIVTLTVDAGIGTDLVIEPGQDVRISGDPGLATAPSWGSSGFAVQERGSLELAYLRIDPVAVLRVTNGGSLSLSSMNLPATVLGTAEGQLSGAGSRLRLSAVTLPEYLAAGELAGTMVVGEDGSLSVDPPRWSQSNPGIFTVSSGPCEVSEGGRCVGRPNGYSPNEDCEIAVGGGGGVVGACAVFDTTNNDDRVTLVDGSQHYGMYGSSCPVGAALSPVATLSWHSNNHWQGSVGDTASCSGCHNGCTAKGTCGLPYSASGLGGGWVVCFA
jgi:hypothetical protein